MLLLARHRWLLLLLSLFAGAVMAQTDADTAARNAATVRASFDAWSAGTGGPFDLLAPEASWTVVGHSLVAKTYESREAFMKEVIRPFNARMSRGLKPEIHGLYADGNTVIVLFDGHALARDGKPYDNTYAWFLEMRDDRIVKATAFFDALVFNDLW
jgi:hypothetical protein